MANDSTISCYDEQAHAYDLYQTAVVPGYQTMLDLTAQTCRRVLKSNAKIIDLGCGTGNASLAAAKVIPVQIYLIDGSKQMVQVAESKLSQVASAEILGRKAANISEENWDEDLPSGEYDAVVSTLVLEHLPFDRYKRTIEKCFELLRPGGWIIAAEGYAEPEAICQRWFFEEMKEHQKMVNPELAEFIAKSRHNKEVHYHCSKAEKAGWWKDIGFQNVDVIWQYLCIALMVGRKPKN
jgi:2-polyprenyl-3-methyl-5-hydroxy-6-metoxy-1,4-benzoquinol methylase